jgi:hypothetical protein
MWRNGTAQLLVRHRLDERVKPLTLFKLATGTQRLGESLDHNLRLEGELPRLRHRFAKQNRRGSMRKIKSVANREAVFTLPKTSEGIPCQQSWL